MRHSRYRTTRVAANSARVGLKTSYTALLDDTGRDLKEAYRLPDHLNYTEYVSSHFDLANGLVQATTTSAAAPEHNLETDRQNFLGESLALSRAKLDPRSPPADAIVPTGRKRDRNEGSNSTPRVRQTSYPVLIWLADVMDTRRTGAPGAVS